MSVRWKRFEPAVSGLVPKRAGRTISTASAPCRSPACTLLTAGTPASELDPEAELDPPDGRQRGDRVERLGRPRRARARPVDIAARGAARAARRLDAVHVHD